jgi:hypothetical protein
MFASSEHACDQWHFSRKFTPLTGLHCCVQTLRYVIYYAGASGWQWVKSYDLVLGQGPTAIAGGVVTPKDVVNYYGFVLATDAVGTAAPHTVPSITTIDISSSSGVDGEMCLECEPQAFLVDGRCKGKLLCKGSSYAEAGYGSCGCGRLLATGEKDKTCGRCDVRKRSVSANALSPNSIEWEHKGLYKTCVQCTKGTYFYAGTCLPAGDCPSHLTSYSFGERKSSCDEPFHCNNRKRVWSLDDSGRDAKQCKCPDSNCAECTFKAGNSNAKNCVQCKRKTYLLNGDCVDSLACIAVGRTPLQPKGGGPRGWICV